ncbi:MAG: deoxyribodipyrimidine photo-lyase [Gammaproteobacteria bacterium]
MSATLLWLRADLRVADHPALLAAIARGRPVVPVFVWAPQEQGAWAPGAASRVWLHHSLAALAQRFRGLGSALVLRRGPSLEALRALCAETGADAVYWTRRYEPWATTRDAGIKQALRREGIDAQSFPGTTIVEPFALQTRGGAPFRVFTPFWRALAPLADTALPLPAPVRLPVPSAAPGSLGLADLGLLPRIDWTGGIRAHWQAGEAGARAALEDFQAGAIDAYGQARDFPARAGVSRLSPHLCFGEISARDAWHAVRAAEAARGRPTPGAGAQAWLRQLAWREFAQHLLYHFPHTPEAPLRPEFAAFGWHEDAASLARWQRGATGVPIVDAGMRALWHTGWMHNRVRMIAASLLVKDLLVDWRAGARWFWDTLVDADLANNTLGWQWIAGCGADAAPYFRIFNPVTQARRFDPDGDYIRRWVPELAAAPTRWIHAPWEATADARIAAGIEGRYPEPVIDHAIARRRALDAYARLRAERNDGS